MLRSLGLGLGLETFVKFLRVSVSVSKNLVSEKSLGFGYGKNLVSEKSLGFGFGKFGSEKSLGFRKFYQGKKSWFQCRKIWFQKKVSVFVLVEILVSSFSDEKK